MKKTKNLIFLLSVLLLLVMTSCGGASTSSSAQPTDSSSAQDAEPEEQAADQGSAPKPGEPESKSSGDEPPVSELDDSESSDGGNEPASGDTPTPWIYEFDTVTLDGAQATEKDFYGNKLTVLNVWATWCPPCVAELPSLQEISEFYADQDVEIVGVLQDGVTASGAIDESVIETARTLIADAGVTYPMILPDDTLTYMFIEDMQYFPTTYLLDSEGKVLKVVVGAGDVSDWKGTINEVLQSVTA